jgi:nitrite reductase/ring-hydroxylating ferredoxin subunit
MKRAAALSSSLARALGGGWLTKRQTQTELAEHLTMTALGRLQDFPDLAATPLTLRLDGQELAILVVRHGNGIRAWLDLCPHRSLPLTQHGGRVLSADGTRLRCSVHLAEFCAREGHALTGGGTGMGLTPVPLSCEAEGVVGVVMEAKGRAGR